MAFVSLELVSEATDQKAPLCTSASVARIQRNVRATDALDALSAHTPRLLGAGHPTSSLRTAWSRPTTGHHKPL